jgi:hypothetical protein
MAPRKTKRAKQPYTCAHCKRTIATGEQYARTSVRLGSSTIHPDGRDAPAWAWEPYRLALPLCEECNA